MRTQIQLILSAIALTALIWTYADQTSHESYTAPAVPVKLIPPPSPGDPYVLRVLDTDRGAGDQILAEMEFRGTRSQVRALKQLNDQNSFRLNLPIATELTPGQRISLNLMQELAGLEEVRERGQLQKVIPEKIVVEVLRYRWVPIQLRFNTGYYENELATPPTYEPQTIQARVLEADLGPEGTLTPLQVDLAPAIDKHLGEADQQSGELVLEVPLVASWAKNIKATFAPPSITVTVRLERRSVTKQITVIPLRLLVDPRSVLGQYAVEVSDEGELLQNVDVHGPQTKVEQLQGKQIDAYVTIADADLPAASTTEHRIEKPVRFVLPTGYEDVEVVSQPRMVKLNIRREINGKTGSLTPIH